METYVVTNEYVSFGKTGKYTDRNEEVITLSKKIVLECAETIKKMELQKTTVGRKSLNDLIFEDELYNFSNRHFCTHCDRDGLRSKYTLISSENINGGRVEDRLELCTKCANHMRLDDQYIVNELTMEISLHAAATANIALEKHSYGSDKIYMKVLRAEIEVEKEEKKKEWYLRACKVGICPKCGASAKTKSYRSNPTTPLTEYRCTTCSFCDVFKT